MTSDERAELAQLRRDERVLAMEVEIIKRTSAYLARENACSSHRADRNRRAALGADLRKVTRGWSAERVVALIFGILSFAGVTQTTQPTRPGRLCRPSPTVLSAQD